LDKRVILSNSILLFQELNKQMQQSLVPGIPIGSLIVSIFSFLIAALALYISRKSWLQANRPIVTARVTSFEKGGEKGTALNIVIENTGNRPAKNIRLSIPSDILEPLLAENEDTKKSWRRMITKVFSERGAIPILGNGKSITNSFGFLSGDKEKTAWKDEARVEIDMSYEDLDGRKFTHKNPLFIAGDEGFASGSWDKAK
jgi:hypothetical protein